MSMPDKLKGAVAGHEDQVREGVDKVADVADEKTEGKYSDQIDTAQEKASEQLGGEQPPATEGAPPPAEGEPPPAEGEQPNPA
jgi:hypothetical protein